MAAALDHMSDRLKAGMVAGMVAGYFGVSAGVNMAPGTRSDLLSLAQVTFIKSRTARIFWDNGYKSVGRRSGSERRRLNPHSFIGDCSPVLSKLLKQRLTAGYLYRHRTRSCVSILTMT
jgi:hypothetical protein